MHTNRAFFICELLIAVCAVWQMAAFDTIEKGVLLHPLNYWLGTSEICRSLSALFHYLMELILCEV
jgi:hypothetical protein